MPNRSNALVAILALVEATGGCGSDAPARAPDDGPANARCTPYKPSAAAWSSLPTDRPPVMGTPVASPTGAFIYAVGTWIDGGAVKHQVVRSGDLGTSWCVLATPDAIAEVIPAPADASVLYAITWSDGIAPPALLRSIDAGTTWSTQGGMPPGAFYFESSAIVVAASDPATIWFTRADGLSLSRDGGKTWSPRTLPSTLNSSTESDFSWVDDIVIDRASPNRALVSGLSGSLDTVNSLNTWPRQTFTTEDWGATWNAVDLPVRPPVGFGPNVILADDASAIYVPAETLEVLWRSTDWCGSWKVGEDVSTRASLAGLTLLGGHRPGELFVWPLRTLDGGASWHELPFPATPAFMPVLAAGDGTVVGLTGITITATSDAGATWRSSAVGPDAGGRSRLDFLSQSPIEPRPLWTSGMFEGEGGGIWYPSLRSGDGGLTWTPISHAGELWDGASADVAFSAPGGGIRRTEDGGLTWQEVPLPSASDRVLAATVCAPPISCLYGLFLDELNGAITTARSDDHGHTWTEATPIPRELGFVGFPGPLTVFPHDPQRLLVPCGGRLCESQDGGATWMPSTLPGPRIDFLANGVWISTSGGVSRSEDDGATWTPVLNTGGKLVISRAHPDTVFLLPDLTGIDAPLLRSDDAGLSWRSALPSAAVPSAASPWTVTAVVDAPDGRFLALVADYGLVTFD